MINEKRKTEISKFLSFVLRHKPKSVGLILEENGWVSVSELLKACAAGGRFLTIEELCEIVETNDKKRFSFDETGKKIRANQGHSAAVEINFEKRVPPPVLYHGTAERNVAAILENGLQKMNRHHVHLSQDKETARNVGARYGKPMIFEIETAPMIAENFEFFVSTNGVWLVEAIPPKFLKIS